MIAFSGGVDSTFLLKVAVEVLGSDNVLAVTSSSRIHPDKEIEHAKKIAEEIGVKHYLIKTSELENIKFIKNDKKRCYYCKSELFGQLHQVAENKGYYPILDGSNYDDKQSDYRPGRKAAGELDIKSPLELAELTKSEIRNLSQRLDLPTWDEPSSACLTTRIPYGEKITSKRLDMIEKAENYLNNYDLKQIRVRHHDDNTARIEVNPKEMPIIINNSQQINKKLQEIGYTYITLDLEGYRTGSMNKIL